MNTLNKGILLDRDGVINVERGDYTFRTEDFLLIDGVLEALQIFKQHNYKLIVVTNQSGISQGLFTREMMYACHEKMNYETNHLIDAIYYAPWHPSVTESLTRKPDTLMLEKAIARFNLDPKNSWLVGDSERDIKAGKILCLNTVYINSKNEDVAADHYATSLLQATKEIIIK